MGGHENLTDEGKVGSGRKKERNKDPRVRERDIQRGGGPIHFFSRSSTVFSPSLVPLTGSLPCSD